jgi:spermidine synthase
VGPGSLVLVEADQGWTTLAQHETPMGLVSVSEKKPMGNEDKAQGYVPLRRLRLGQHFRMGGSIAFGERRMGHLALLLHGAPERALFLGIGTGATLSAVLAYPLERIDAVELIPKVVDELHQFSTINLKVSEDPRVAFHKADARRFVTASRDQYDVVVADLFHPGLDGAGGLYAHEHFEHVAARLAPGGLFVQWLPLYQFDDVTLRSVIGTFCDVFPEVHSMLGIYNVQHPAVALVGRVPQSADDRLRIDVDALTAKLQEPVFADLLMQDPRDLLGAYMLDREALVALSGDAPRNTDLRPVITLRAPRVAYEGAGRHGVENLRTLLDRRTSLPTELLVGDPARVEALQAEVDRFANALQAYLDGEELRSRASSDAPVPEAAIDAYLRAYAIAPEFTPARGLLYDLAKQRAAWAERILPAMMEATPDEPRVWKTWILYLRRQGDPDRVAEAEAEAQARFGGASSP